MYHYGHVIFSTNHDLVRIHDCVESMSNGEDSAVLEVGTNSLLNDLISAVSKE